MADYKRERAGRAFAFELLDTTVSIKDESNSKSPVFVLTPTGGLFNRVLICGTLMDKDRSEGGKSEFWKGQLYDRTAAIQITAGEYNLEAMTVLAGIEDLPKSVAVVGKPNVYEREEKKYISIRAESINEIPEEDVKKWIIDTAEATAKRLDAMRAAKEDNAKDALIKYDVTDDDINAYKIKIVGALMTLLPKPEHNEVESEPIEVVDLRPKNDAECRRH